MLLSMICAVIVSQPATVGPVAVVVSHKRASAEGAANRIALKVHAAVVRAGLSGALDPASTQKQLPKATFIAAAVCLVGAIVLFATNQTLFSTVARGRAFAPRRGGSG